MSTELAIASVTAVLMDLLNNGIIDHDITGAVGGNVTVTALPPDRIDTTVPSQQTQLNLFMYQAVPNQGWRNEGLPSRNGRGERLTNPPLALDLQYMLTAYGAEELHAEILLGYGMHLLHETPVLARDAIRRSLAPPSTVSGAGLPAGLRALSVSGLAEQIEQIKITPVSLTTEEISKLWSAFQAKYRPTATYQASVVLIEGDHPTRTPLPVRSRLVYVAPYKQPVIEKVVSQTGAGAPIVENQPILAGYNLVVRGRNLRGDATVLNVGGIDVTPDAAGLSDTQIIVPVPAGLTAGIHGLQVKHERLLGSPPTPHKGIESSVAPFVLSPGIQSVNASAVQSLGGDQRSGNIDVTVKPAVTEAQRLVLLLNEKTGAGSGPGESPAAYSFNAPPLVLSPPGSTEDISIPFTGVKAADYLVRVKVDGAESPLSCDSTGRYNQPEVSIP